MRESLCSPLRNNLGIRPRFYVEYNTVTDYEARLRTISETLSSYVVFISDTLPRICDRTFSSSFIATDRSSSAMAVYVCISSMLSGDPTGDPAHHG